MVDMRIDGSALLRQVADHIRVTGDRGLSKEMSAGLRRAAKPIQAAIRASAEETMPETGGYAAEFTKSVRFRTAVRAGGRAASFRLTTFADGKSQRRDIRALNSGKLRHPVYGRSRRLRGGTDRVPNPWSITQIKPGFWDRGTDSAAGEAEKEMITVLDGLAARLAKG
jgi:hypothetical protein